jgi:hypothetical protein
VIVIAPVMAVLAAWTRWLTAALGSLVLAMLGSFGFGLYHHFVAVSPDHVAHLPDGSARAHLAFIASAVLLAAIELLTAAYGALALRAVARK